MKAETSINETGGHCPKCNGTRNAYIRAQHKKEWQDQYGINFSSVHQVLECAGCSTLFFQIEETDDYSVETEGEAVWVPELGTWGCEVKRRLTHYPETKRAKPDWLAKVGGQDETLARLLRELYDALNSDLRVLAAIGVRTVFDRASELLDVDVALSFRAKLDELVRQGRIGADERGILDTLIDAGNAATHRGWAPDSNDIATMMDILEGFLQRAFVLQAGATEMAARVPPRQAKTTKPATKGRLPSR